MDPVYDAVVVGARCAGSATAMLMARAGMRVLLLDRVHPGRDTLSTHALMRAGVLQLERWGLLDAIVAHGTPPVTGVTFHYADGDEGVELAQPLYAPRRTVLDAVLFDAAVTAGVHTRLGVGVTGVSRDSSGRVVGVQVRSRGGDPEVVRAGLTVGADGLRSTIAGAVGASTTWQGAAGAGIVYGYWPAAPTPHYAWFSRPGGAAGVIPTNHGQVCVWASLPASRFAQRRPADTFAAVMDAVAPEAAEIIDGAEQDGRLRGFPGAPARLRQAAGPGWALVGDAGSFKDPLTAHGITDALRDAELLARAAVDGSPEAFDGYERTRDALTIPLLEVAERIVGYEWDTAEIRALLRAESAAMRPEVDVLRALDTPTSRRAA
jgi:flavin-dependent dehydrogenase